MTYKMSSLGYLNHLITQVDNRALRILFETWVENNVKEFGYSISTTRQYLEHIKDDDKGKYMEYQYKKVAHEIGQKMIDECASFETYDTQYGEITNIKLFGIKHFGEK